MKKYSLISFLKKNDRLSLLALAVTAGAFIAFIYFSRDMRREIPVENGRWYARAQTCETTSKPTEIFSPQKGGATTSFFRAECSKDDQSYSADCDTCVKRNDGPWRCYGCVKVEETMR